jgi:pimeloyl-ACP methyl ester carboxylesterase
VLPAAGHLLCFEQPQSFNTAIHSFLSHAFTSD